MLLVRIKQFTILETVKEIAEIEMCKFELWELY